MQIKSEDKLKSLVSTTTPQQEHQSLANCFNKKLNTLRLRILWTSLIGKRQCYFLNQVPNGLLKKITQNPIECTQSTYTGVHNKNIQSITKKL